MHSSKSKIANAEKRRALGTVGRDDNELLAAGYVRLPKILDVLPVSRSTWIEGVRKGRFPQGVKIGSSVAWRRSDIIALLKSLPSRGQK